MNKSDLTTLFDFNRWANARTLEAIKSVPEEKLYLDLKDSFGGIHATLVHYCGAENVWLQRLTGVTPPQYMKKEDYPTYASVKVKLLDVEEGYKKYFSTLTEEDLLKDYIITTQKGDTFAQKVWQSLQHLVNHSSYHRGQITTMIRQVGGTPIGTDLISFYRLQNKQ